MAQALTTINATISRVTDRGFQIREQPGKTLIVSDYARPKPPVPPAGTEVELGLDSRGFVYEIRLVSAPAAPTAPESASTPATGGHTSASKTTPVAPGGTESAASSFSYERATLYARCLQAAAAMVPGPGDVEATEQLADVFFRKCCERGMKGRGIS